VVPEAARLAGPHVDPAQIPLAFFADAATREINAMQDADRARIMYADLDGRLREMDRMGVVSRSSRRLRASAITRFRPNWLPRRMRLPTMVWLPSSPGNRIVWQGLGP